MRLKNLVNYFFYSLLALATIGMTLPVLPSAFASDGLNISVEVFKRSADRDSARERNKNERKERARNGNGNKNRDRARPNPPRDRDRTRPNPPRDRDRTRPSPPRDRDRTRPAPPRDRDRDRTRPRPPRRDDDNWRRNPPRRPAPPRNPPRRYDDDDDNWRRNPPRRPLPPRRVPPRSECAWDHSNLSCTLLRFRWARPHDSFSLRYRQAVDTNWARRIGIESVYNRGKRGRTGTIGIRRLVVEYTNGERHDLTRAAMRRYPNRVTSDGNLYLAFEGDRMMLPLRPHRYLRRIHVTADSWIDQYTDAFLGLTLER